MLECVVQLKGWSGFEMLLSELRHQQYQIRFANLDASLFGALQTRRWLFVLWERERDVPAIPRSRKPAPPASSILRPVGTVLLAPPLWRERFRRLDGCVPKKSDEEYEAATPSQKSACRFLELRMAPAWNGVFRYSAKGAI